MKIEISRCATEDCCYFCGTHGYAGGHTIKYKHHEDTDLLIGVEECKDWIYFKLDKVSYIQICPDCRVKLKKVLEERKL